MMRAPVDPKMPEQEREEDELSSANVIARITDLAEAICDFREQVEERLCALEARLGDGRDESKT